MKIYVVLVRGINVGGKNILPMADLRTCLEGLGFSDVLTYIASGNIILRSEKSAEEIRDRIEKVLPQHFKLDSDLVKVLVLTYKELRSVIDKKPKGFGERPQMYHSDIIFLMGVSSAEALKVFDPREGVDQIWKGSGVIYSQRVSALRTKSRLGRIAATPLYKSMTIRNWNTTTKLLEMIEKQEGLI